MARKATSPEEIGQIARVHALLSEVGVAPSPEIVVTLVNGTKFTGHLLQDRVVNRPGKAQSSRVYSGAMTLETKDGEVEIDYLDVVWLQKARRSN